MFYSTQFLSRKTPLGQIWIAAVMKKTINRKKAAMINIEEACDKITTPEVPFALRLSGILMEGVVIIFARKVAFLLEDANDFKLKLHDIKVPAEKKKEKTSMRKAFENVTVNYEFGSFSNEMGLPLLQPCDQDYIMLRGDQPDLNQVRQEDITLPDDIPQPGIDRISSAYANDAFEDGVDNPYLKDFLTELDGNAGQDQVPAGGDPADPIMQDEEAQNPEKKPQREVKKRTNKRKRLGRKPRMDNGGLEISAQDFQKWLRDPRDILADDGDDDGDEIQRCCERLLHLPFMGIEVCGTEVNSGWSDDMLQVWNRNVRKEAFSHKEPGSSGSHKNQKASAVDDQPNDMSGAQVGLDPLDTFGSVERARAGANTPSSDGPFRHSTPDATAPVSPRSGHPSSGHAPAVVMDVGILGEVERHDSIFPNLAENTPLGALNVLEPEEVMMESGDRAGHKSSTGEGKSGLLSQFDMDETYEEADDSFAAGAAEGLDRRSACLLRFYNDTVFPEMHAKPISFNGLLDGSNRFKAAQAFYYTCVLVTRNYLKVEQIAPYADIMIVPGPNI